MLCGQFTHFTCSENRNGLAFKCIENLFSEFNGGVTNRNGTSSDSRLGADPFTDTESLGKKTIENCAPPTGFPRSIVSGLNLSQYLGFTDHHRIKARCHSEEVLDRLQVMMEIRPFLERPYADPVVVGEEFH